MGLVHELGVDALHIMVVHKVVELDMGRDHPVGALNGVGDLKVIVVVVPAVQGLVQGVVGDGVQGVLVCPAGVVPVDHLAHEPEVRLDLVGGAPQGLHELKIQHVGGVETDAVHVELADPEADHVTDIIPDGGVSLVELHQQVVAAPVVVGEAVVILVVAPEVHVAVPVPIGGGLPVGLQILERKEITPGVVEDAVKYDPDVLCVAGSDKVLQILVRAEAVVQKPVVGGLVAMPHGLEERADVEGGEARLLQLPDPGQQRVEPMHRLAVIVLPGGPGETQRINVVKYRFIVPCHLNISPSKQV